MTKTNSRHGLLVIATSYALLLAYVHNQARANSIPVIYAGTPCNPQITSACSWSLPSNWIPAGTVPINAPGLNYSVVINSGSPTTDVPVVVDQVTLNGGQIYLNQPLHTGSLTVSNGSISGTGKLNVDGDVVIDSGSIGNSGPSPDGFTVGGTVYKQGYGAGSINAFSPTGDYGIVVEQGTFSFSNGGTGSTVGGISIASPEFARVSNASLTSTSDNIYLNNATGFGHTGALTTSGSGAIGVAGEVYLGDQGAVIGPWVSFSNAIHGGTLDLRGRGTDSISSANSTYTGTTKIGINGDQTNLALNGGGRLQSTSGIDIGHYATLALVDDQQFVPDRIADSVPISMRGGLITLYGTVGTTGPTETLGNLNLLQSASEIYESGENATLTFKQLNRSENATVNFRLSSTGTTTNTRVYYQNQPQLTDNILGGWATFGDTDFATYDPQQGIVALGHSVPRPSQINGAGPHDHVLIDGVSPSPTALTTDTTIGTLAVTVEGPISVDLGGHLLTLSDGGFTNSGVSNFSSIIQNGRLTAGTGAQPAMLHVHSQWLFNTPPNPVQLSAAIVDNAAGGSVSLVKSGNVDVWISGNNTYTGSTIAQDGRLFVSSQAALPDGSDLLIDGGEVNLHYAPLGPKQLGTVTLRQGGTLDATRIGSANQSALEVDAQSYQLESGQFNATIAGSGTVHKTTDGAVFMNFDNPNFYGNVQIEQGTLVQSRLAPHSLGAGETTVLPGGTLAHTTVTVNSNYVRLQSSLNLAGGDVGLDPNATHWDFDDDWRVSASSCLLLFDPLGTRELTSPTVNLLRSVTIQNGSTLSVLGQGSVNFTSGVSIDGDTTLDVDAGTAVINSLIGTNNAMFNLRGGGSVQLPSALATAPNFQLAVNIAQGATATTSTTGTFQLGAGVSLRVDGKLANTAALNVNGGTVSGNGSIQTVDNASGQVSPGDGIGTLSVASYTQGPQGTLNIELGGLNQGSNYDLLAIAGPASLDGLLNVSLTNGFVPNLGNTFRILTAGVLNGQFASLSLPALPFGEFWDEQYQIDSLTLNVVTATQAGDYNHDGTIDQADYQLWRSVFGTTDPAADGNGDGVVDAADYVIWRQHFVHPGVSASAPVPEPSAAALLVVIWVAVAICSRGRKVGPICT